MRKHNENRDQRFNVPSETKYIIIDKETQMDVDLKWVFAISKPMVAQTESSPQLFPQSEAPFRLDLLKSLFQSKRYDQLFGL